MALPQFIREFIKWRWAPSVGLGVGSSFFVVLAAWLIPSQFNSQSEPSATRAVPSTAHASRVDPPSVEPIQIPTAALDATGEAPPTAKENPTKAWQEATRARERRRRRWQPNATSNSASDREPQPSGASATSHPVPDPGGESANAQAQGGEPPPDAAP